MKKQAKAEAPAGDMIEAYRQLHANPKYFRGTSGIKHRDKIGHLCRKHLVVCHRDEPRLLDFGCGKGHQYLVARVHLDWGDGRTPLLPYCYDPGVPGLDKPPEENAPYDGVICTDVLEHVPEEQVPAFLDRLLSFHPKFVFTSISLSPAKNKTLPDGRNVHVCVKPRSWWKAEIDAALKRAGKPDCELVVMWEDDPCESA